MVIEGVDVPISAEGVAYVKNSNNQSLHEVFGGAKDNAGDSFALFQGIPRDFFWSFKLPLVADEHEPITLYRDDYSGKSYTLECTDSYDIVHKKRGTTDQDLGQRRHYLSAD